MTHLSPTLKGSAKSARLASAFLSIGMILSEPAYAYLDAGTGTMIIQIILGGVAGIAVAGKLFWSQLVDFFRNPFRRKGAQESESMNLPSEGAEPATDQGSERKKSGN